MIENSVSPAALDLWLHDGGELALFDVREHGQYGMGHLLFAISVPYSRLEVDAARLAPRRGVRMVLVDDDGRLAVRAAARLREAGYTAVHILEGGQEAWVASCRPVFAGVNVPSKAFGELVEQVCHTPSVTSQELAAMQASREDLIVLDGRPLEEYRKMSIPGAVCCPNGELAYRIAAMVPDTSTTIVVNCAGRTRSIIGAQTLINLGVENPVYALENGTQGWYLNDLPLDSGASRHYPGPPAGELLEQARSRSASLAQRIGVPQIGPEQIRAWLDEDRTVFLCDVRTPEEFRGGSLPGAVHAPGGQLVQATDHTIGVRAARIVVFDDDGVRAPVIAGWLRQLGHDAHVLAQGAAAPLDPLLAERLRPDPVLPGPELDRISADALEAARRAGTVTVLDLRAGMAYRKAHVPGAQWVIRPRLSAQWADAQTSRDIVLVSDDPALSVLLASELPPGIRARELEGGMAAWEAAGHETEASPNTPDDADCIDYLFFVHDRHDGNKQAARQYLAWELDLLGQIDDRDKSTFSPVPAV